jgi:hypothetical protein
VSVYTAKCIPGLCKAVRLVSRGDLTLLAPDALNSSSSLPSPPSPHRRLDRDPLTGQPAHWWLLAPLEALQINFRGVGLGLLTHVGPDSGIVRCRITTAAGALVSSQSHTLFDR